MQAKAPTKRIDLRSVFLGLMAGIYATTFASLWWQAAWLWGPNGLVPTGALLEVAREQVTGVGARLWEMPTLAWWLPGDHAVPILCGLGLASAVFSLSSRHKSAMLAVSWLCHLSLLPICDVFLHFQWDLLLTEAGLVSIVIALGTPAQSPVGAWWALRLILFRLMFFSGFVKLASGDPLWRNGGALDFHFFTQPLPNAVGWAAAHLPHPVLVLGTFATLFIELVLPWGMFAGRKFRRPAFYGTVTLMLLLALTGSYGFFQLLTVTLALSLLQDISWRDQPDHTGLSARERAAGYARSVAGWGVFCLVLGTSVLLGAQRYFRIALPPSLEPAATLASRLAVGVPYGPFAVMTTERSLPLLQARWSDGPNPGAWTDLTWRWQTSDPARRPAQAAPFMPRFDWQLWFAGLAPCARNPWLVSLMHDLVDGRAEAADLVGDPRLRVRAPDAVRMMRVRYKPAPLDAQDGAWWTRSEPVLMCEPVMRAPTSHKP